jgi:hypothetical protein
LHQAICGPRSTKQNCATHVNWACSSCRQSGCSAWLIGPSTAHVSAVR